MPGARWEEGKQETEAGETGGKRLPITVGYWSGFWVFRGTGAKATFLHLNTKGKGVPRTRGHPGAACAGHTVCANPDPSFPSATGRVRRHVRLHETVT